MDPHYIVAEIHRAGSTAQRLANAAGYSRSYVSLVIHNKRRNPRIEKEISDTTGIALWRLWPDRYGAPEQND